MKPRGGRSLIGDLYILKNTFKRSAIFKTAEQRVNSDAIEQNRNAAERGEISDAKCIDVR